MSAEVARRASSSPVLPGAGEWERMKEMAKIVASTEFVPQGLRGRPEAVLAALLAGRELGVGAMQALQHINVIDGKVNYSAELLVAKIRAAGHSLVIESQSEEAVVVVGTRADTGDTHTVAWSMQDAAAAGLTGKTNWKKYPRAMMTWRAVTELARFLFADVCSGLGSYTTEELGGDVGPPPVLVDRETGEIIATDPEGRTLILGDGGSVEVVEAGEYVPPESAEPRPDPVDFEPEDSGAGPSGPLGEEPSPPSGSRPPDDDVQPVGSEATAALLRAAVASAQAMGLDWTEGSILGALSARAKAGEDPFAGAQVPFLSFADLNEEQVRATLELIEEKLAAP